MCVFSVNTTKKQRVISTCVSWILKHTLAYFSACLIPSSHVLQKEANDGWRMSNNRMKTGSYKFVLVSLIVNCILFQNNLSFQPLVPLVKQLFYTICSCQSNCDEAASFLTSHQIMREHLRERLKTTTVVLEPHRDQMFAGTVVKSASWHLY